MHNYHQDNLTTSNMVCFMDMISLQLSFEHFFPLRMCNGIAYLSLCAGK
jgi:hypothetical protein